MIHMQLELLAHYSYHWFWGMVYRAVPDEKSNLAIQVKALDENPLLLAQCQEEHDRINGYFFVTRFFYRLFNIDGCNERYYQLMAFTSYQDDFNELPRYSLAEPALLFNFWSKFLNLFTSMPMEKMWAHLVGAERQARSSDELFAIDDEPVIRIPPVYQQREHTAQVPENKPVKTFAELAEEVKAHRAILNAKLSQLSQAFEALHDNDSVTVTPSMLPLLQLLQDYVEGDDAFSLHQAISTQDIKALYKRAALKSHPDKGGSQSAFIAVSNASAQLHEQLSANMPSSSKITEMDWSIRRLTSEEAELAELESGLAALADADARAQAEREAAAREREAAAREREAAARDRGEAALRETQLLQLLTALQSQLPALPRPEPEAPIHFPPLFKGETPHDVGAGAEQEEELTDVPHV